MKLIKIINPENVSDEEVKSYRTHEAVRAVVINEENKIALLYVSKENYYKLPGGGIEKSEDHTQGLKRECLEEIGYDIEIINEIGFTIEYWKPYLENQTSYCYLAKVQGSKHSTNLTAEEKERGFKEVWLSYDEAIKVLNESVPVSIEGREYIVPRDLALLEESKLHLSRFTI